MPSSAFGGPRAAPSFPTRRSSDLLSQGDRARGTGGQHGAACDVRHYAGSRRDRLWLYRRREADRGLRERLRRRALYREAAGGGGRRSEEHTSELQSLTKLVCRLLLSAAPEPPPLSLHDALPISFHKAIGRAAQAANTGRLVTFGITPDRAETGYGYIAGGKPIEGCESAFAVARFIEKPQAAEAEDRKSTRLNSSH